MVSHHYRMPHSSSASLYGIINLGNQFLKHWVIVQMVPPLAMPLLIMLDYYSKQIFEETFVSFFGRHMVHRLRVGK